MKKLFLVFSIAVSSFGFGQVIQTTSEDLRIADSIRKSDIDWDAVYSEFYILLNEYRKENNLSELVYDSTVFQVAKFQSDWMLANKKLTHDNDIPGYKTIEDRCKSYGVNSYSGECCMQGAFIVSIVQHKRIANYLLDEWKRSPGHNRVLILSDTSKVGLSVSKQDYAGSFYVCLVVSR